MASLQNFTDMTGSLSPDEVNQQDITNIIQEIGRTSDQLDALNNTLGTAAYGSLTYNWDGTGSGAVPVQSTLTAPFSSQGNFIGMAFVTLASENNKNFWAMPYQTLGTNGNGDVVIDKYFISGTSITKGTFEVVVNFYAPNTPDTYTFFYIIFVQPTGLSAS